MIKKKECKRCKKIFFTNNKKIFCDNSCKCKYWDKVNSDKRPRKTNKCYSSSKKIRETVNITDEQYSILIGTLLGDGCLIKSSKTEESTLYKVFFTHSERQLDYISWKLDKFKSLCTNGLIKYERKEKRTDGSPLVQYHLQTIGHDDISKVKGILYRSNKKFVTRKYLNLVDALALAVWYMDDGSYSHINKNSTLHTSGFSLSEHRSIKKWFWQKWRIECSIGKISNKSTGKEYLLLYFNREDTKKLHNIISKFVIPSMQYKLNPQRLIR